ncbi:Mannosylfructose-phosphate phosphatase [Rosistilla carotiformis]|uniref:Mannosylfructose-phosphate phosphatase n=1 Tax=Rosistilla carotiformis TaxID=2528017 RepID=A0A518JWG4_9BACT|nr:HAD-IIB family hydrolase [Rosistilla carotiformis]QDV69876.1 Mannosylfructose-phosphate phosphatase [Rosistilla carotiformis]
MTARPTVLATDLDGTLIPLEGNPANRRDLLRLHNHFESADATLVFVTGRHLESARQAITDFQLPCPDWIVCDVGSTICRSSGDGRFESVAPYEACLDKLADGVSLADVHAALKSIDGLRLQESEKQGRFKLSYYADQAVLPTVTQQVGARISELPYSMISSVDPFNGDGLIDLLPRGTSKAFALQWWTEHVGREATDLIFAGDSGNDLAALTAGYRAIVVGNASDAVVQAARAAHRDAGWTDRLHVAREVATSGVLEGCRFHGLIDAE